MCKKYPTEANLSQLRLLPIEQKAMKSNLMNLMEIVAIEYWIPKALQILIISI